MFCAAVSISRTPEKRRLFKDIDSARFVAVCFAIFDVKRRNV